VNRSREEASVRGDEVITAGEAATKLRGGVILRLDESLDDEAILNRTIAVCKAHPGDCPLFLQVATAGGETALIRCNNAMAVESSARCLYALADVIGMERVLCIGLRRKPIPWPELMERPVPLPSAAAAPAAGLAPVGAGS